MPDKDLHQIEEVVKEVISGLMEVWRNGEGGIIVEVRNETGAPRAKIKIERVRRV